MKKQTIVAVLIAMLVLVGVSVNVSAESGRRSGGELRQSDDSSESHDSNDDSAEDKSSSTDDSSSRSTTSSDNSSNRRSGRSSAEVKTDNTGRGNARDNAKVQQNTITEVKTESVEDRLKHFGLNEVKRQKLDDKKAKVCQDKQSEVNKAIDRVRARSNERFERLSKLTEMVMKYYQDKKLSVDNYDQLVATIESTKLAAEAKKNEVVQSPKFDCSSDGPKADIQSFELKRREKSEAFEAYRDAVKALANAVKTAGENQTTQSQGESNAQQ